MFREKKTTIEAIRKRRKNQEEKVGEKFHEELHLEPKENSVKVNQNSFHNLSVKEKVRIQEDKTD